MRSLSYVVVDVFTRTPLEGNPLAVFTDAHGLDAATMQRIAREMNLSETTFVLPAAPDDVAATVRIFTPNAELAFAGHPTIGTAFVLRALGRIEREARSFALREGIGDVRVRVDAAEDLLWLTTPPIAERETLDTAACLAALGLDADDGLPGAPCRVLSAGNACCYVPLRNPATVDRCEPRTAAIRALFAGAEPAGVVALAPTGRGAYARAFFPHLDVVEDPATGSAAGPLGRYLLQHGLVSAAGGARFVVDQGVAMGRPSEIHVLAHGDAGSAGIEIGGASVVVAEGVLRLP